jgi:hypothetical protein
VIAMTNDTPSIQSGKPDAGRMVPSKVSSAKRTTKPKPSLEEMSRLISRIYVELVQRSN